jgi:hypothetical protein
VEERRWSAWQILVLILVLIAAAVLVITGLPDITPAAPATEEARVSPGSRATRPAIQTNTPTATSPPTSTPGPSPTSTATPTPTHTPSPSPTPTNTPIVVNPKLKALGRLETAQYVMQVIVDLEREPANIWQEVFGTDKLLLVAEGEVVAGFDLAKVTADDVHVDGTHVSLRLPPPEILHYAVDERKTYVYERETGFLVRPDATLETEARRIAQDEVLDWAEEHDIYEKAEEFGVLYLEGFLRSLGFTGITIEVEDVNEG